MESYEVAETGTGSLQLFCWSVELHLILGDYVPIRLALEGTSVRAGKKGKPCP